MSDQLRQARSYGSVAEAYDRARPSYPPEAVDFLLGRESLQVLELGAGTGKLTELLLAAGHRVVATDPSPEMLGHLQQRAPSAESSVAVAERLPFATRSFDAVVCAESFHWFEHGPALDEIARVLRPGGVLALAWNVHDEGIPWVKKLGRITGTGTGSDLAGPLHDSAWFGEVHDREYRFWQHLDRDHLVDLARSRSAVAVLDHAERAEVLDRVRALYDDYGRGPDGMKLPYVTRCFRAVVTDAPPEPPTYEDDVLEIVGEDAALDPDATQPVPRPDDVRPPHPPDDSPDDSTVLIDFR